jgi:hypothetical protein
MRLVPVGPGANERMSPLRPLLWTGERLARTATEASKLRTKASRRSEPSLCGPSRLDPLGRPSCPTRFSS